MNNLEMYLEEKIINIFNSHSINVKKECLYQLMKFIDGDELLINNENERIIFKNYKSLDPYLKDLITTTVKNCIDNIYIYQNNTKI